MLGARLASPQNNGNHYEYPADTHYYGHPWHRNTELNNEVTVIVNASRTFMGNRELSQK